MSERPREDVESEKESIADAETRIDAFVEFWRDELKATILGYADGPAEDLWRNLRERFWVGEPLPKRKPNIIPKYNPEDP